LQNLILELFPRETEQGGDKKQDGKATHLRKVSETKTSSKRREQDMPRNKTGKRHKSTETETETLSSVRETDITRNKTGKRHKDTETVTETCSSVRETEQEGDN